MALKVARRGAVPPFIAMEVLRDANERAARGENILHLEVGQPSTSAPRSVLAPIASLHAYPVATDTSLASVARR